VREWQPIDTVPRDGRFVDLTWMDRGKPQEVYSQMRWDARATNGLFPGKRGFWVHASGEFTWNEDGDGGPTHWREGLQ
jgi:hypothetical protein